MIYSAFLIIFAIMFIYGLIVEILQQNFIIDRDFGNMGDYFMLPLYFHAFCLVGGACGLLFTIAYMFDHGVL